MTHPPVFTRRLASAAAAVLVTCSIAHAADPETGDWSAMITPPEGETQPATITVSEADGQIRMGISVFGQAFAVSNIEVSDDALLFSWMPGPQVNCELDLQDDGSFDGDCIDTNGETGHITMSPPE